MSEGWTPEQEAAFREAYPPGTVVKLEGGTLDIGLVRASTRAERRLRPVFWLLDRCRLRRVSSRLHRWAAPDAHRDLDQFVEAWRQG